MTAMVCEAAYKQHKNNSHFAGFLLQCALINGYVIFAVFSIRKLTDFYFFKKKIPAVNFGFLCTYL